jgi:DNA invertase Pin-like site-specific DNA recombinase
MIDLNEFQRFGKKKEVIPDIKKEVWCYTRVSTKDQENNYSLGNQKSEAEKFAQENMFQLSRIFGGTYESGKEDFTRREFMNLLDEVKKSKNRPHAILVYKMNRFSRSGGKSIAIVNEIIDRYGVHLIEITSRISTETPKGRNELNRRLLAAEEENINKLEHTIPGMKSFILAGNWLGKAPLGYTHYGPKTTDHSRWNPTQRIELNDTGKILKQAWHWKLECVQDYVILRRLNDLGIKMSLQKLSSMWRNPFYCGLISSKFLDGKVIQGNHEPLISPEIFLKVNQINTKRPQGYQIEKLSSERPLIGSLLCYKCGRKLTGYLVKKKGLHYYKCQKCKGVAINTQKHEYIHSKVGAHELFVELLKSYELKPELVEPFKLQIKKMIELSVHSQKAEESLNKKKLTDLEAQRDSLEERFAFGRINEELFQKFHSKIEEEISAFKGGNESSQINISDLQIHLDKTLDFIQNISKYWVSGNIDIKKRIQKLVFPAGFYIDPLNRKYLTSEVNCLFRLNVELSRVSEEQKKEIPIKNDEDYRVVAGAGSSLKKYGTD